MCSCSQNKSINTKKSSKENYYNLAKLSQGSQSKEQYAKLADLAKGYNTQKVSSKGMVVGISIGVILLILIVVFVLYSRQKK